MLLAFFPPTLCMDLGKEVKIGTHLIGINYAEELEYAKHLLPILERLDILQVAEAGGAEPESVLGLRILEVLLAKCLVDNNICDPLLPCKLLKALARVDEARRKTANVKAKIGDAGGLVVCRALECAAMIEVNTMREQMTVLAEKAAQAGLRANIEDPKQWILGYIQGAGLS